MRVEKFLNEDLTKLLAIFHAARESDEGLPSDTVSYDEFLSLVEGEEIYVALIDGNTVGFVSVWRENRFLHHLYVLPALQGKGAGSALIEKCRQVFGAPLRLKCALSNLSACQYYDESGWIRESEGDDSSGPYINYRLG